MTWIAPGAPPFGGSLVADERTLLEGFLDWQRAVLVGKCTGLTGEELAQRSAPPSTLSAARAAAARDRRGAGVVPPAVPRGVRALPVPRGTTPRTRRSTRPTRSPPRRTTSACCAQWQASRVAVAGGGAGRRLRGSSSAGRCRYAPVYLHLIQEYARHNGHADLLRQRIDGETGLTPRRRTCSQEDAGPARRRPCRRRAGAVRSWRRRGARFRRWWRPGRVWWVGGGGAGAAPAVRRRGRRPWRRAG